MRKVSMTPYKLHPVNPQVYGVHTKEGLHVGNLKRIGGVWKFKGVGYDGSGHVIPGGGPLTGRHNTVFAVLDENVVTMTLSQAL